MHPSSPFRIRLPRVLRGSNHALPENKKSSGISKDDVNMMDCAEKEKLIVEAYTPPDPGPYPQDQPKQNSVRFTPTQVLFQLFAHPVFALLFSCKTILTAVKCKTVEKFYFLGFEQPINYMAFNIVATCKRKKQNYFLSRLLKNEDYSIS